MACRRKKARLRNIGVLCRALGQSQLRIQTGQLLGAIAHPLFQGCIGAFQRFGGLERGSDVGKGDDKAAAGHPVGADLDHHVAILEALQIRFALGRIGGKACCRQAGVVADAGAAQRAHEFEDFPQGYSELHEVRRQREDFAELSVGANQL